jgi:8-oxo-dGTP diphosphatase
MPFTGKKTDMTLAWMAVVAGALMRADGRWLMHRRQEGKQHAGLWEFPGGKVEAHEMPMESLCRELREELGIRCDPAACIPVAFAETAPAVDPVPIVILLYTVVRWTGEPAALEGGEIGWFTPQEVSALAKPPLDVLLSEHLFQNW